MTKWFTKRLLKSVGVKVTTNWLKPVDGAPALYVANHVSYLDALVMLSEIDAVFITSKETGETPGLGWLCRLGGTLFTERRSIWNLPQEVAEIEEYLNSGLPVVLFPEGTTSPGTYLLDFKSSLVEGAMKAGVEVRCIHINFPKINGHEPFLEDRDTICWYGDTDFTPHFLRALFVKSLEVNLTEFDNSSWKSLKDRKQVTSRVKQVMTDNYLPVIPPGRGPGKIKI